MLAMYGMAILVAVYMFWQVLRNHLAVEAAEE